MKQLGYIQGIAKSEMKASQEVAYIQVGNTQEISRVYYGIAKSEIKASQGVASSQLGNTYETSK